MATLLVPRRCGLATVALALVFTSQFHSCFGDVLALGYTRDKVEPRVRLEVWAFPLEEVRLSEGPFRHAQDLAAAYLLSLDTDRLVRTVDSVNPGEEQNERDHNQKGEKSSSGDFGDHFYLDAAEGGWFSWDLKTLPDEPQNLVLTYWGEDRGRQFDVMIDGQKLATERLTASHPGAYFDQVYPLPVALTKGKQKVTLRFQGSNTWVGGVFGVRVMKTAENP